MKLLTIVAAASVFATPFAVSTSFAQDALSVKIGTETAAPRNGAMPMPSLKLGVKGKATAATTKSGLANVESLALSDTALPPVENK